MFLLIRPKTNYGTISERHINPETNGERALFAAVIEQAIFDYLRRGEGYRDAADFLTSPERLSFWLTPLEIDPYVFVRDFMQLDKRSLRSRFRGNRAEL